MNILFLFVGQNTKTDKSGNSRPVSYFSGLLDDAVPYLIRQQHILLYEVLLNSLICLGPDHITNCLIERVHLDTDRKNCQQASLIGQVKEIISEEVEFW